jgi:hypothetical protein
LTGELEGDGQQQHCAESGDFLSQQDRAGFAGTVSRQSLAGIAEFAGTQCTGSDAKHVHANAAGDSDNNSDAAVRAQMKPETRRLKIIGECILR